MSLIKKYHTCPLRTLEIERFSAYLETKKTQAVIIGSCVVTKQVEQLVLNSIRDAVGEIWVVGCLSKRVRKEVEKKDNAKILTTIELNHYLQHGSETYSDIQNTPVCYSYDGDDLCNRQYSEIARLSQSKIEKLLHKKTRIPFLVVARGCNCHCSFCHTRFYIGKVKSKSIFNLKEEYLKLIENHNFVNIIAEDVGSYGTDQSTSLPELLKELDLNTGNKKVKWMIDGLQPNYCSSFKDALIPLLAKRRITALSIPVQSGSSRILELMNRKSDVEEFIATIKEFKETNPELFLQGIFIIGFPSETDQDLDQTIDFILKAGFNDITLIPYSEFEICDAAKIPGKIDEKIIYDRIRCAKLQLNKVGIITRA